MNHCALTLDAISISIGQVSIIRSLSLQLQSGSWTALVGPNGCGKTTLLRCAAGHLAPRTGRILIHGRDLYRDSIPALLPGFGSTPDVLPGFLTGRQCLEIYAAARHIESIPQGILELAARLQFSRYLDTPVRTCSLGTRQKLAILLALLGNPQVVLLDEVFNGLDPVSALALKEHLGEQVRQQSLTVLLATHSLDIVARHCDRMVQLVEGQIAGDWCRAEIEAAEGTGGLALALATRQASPG